MIYDSKLETIDVIAVSYLHHTFEFKLTKTSLANVDTYSLKANKYLFYVAKDCYEIAKQRCGIVARDLIERFEKWQAIIESEDLVREWEDIHFLKHQKTLAMWYREDYLKSRIWSQLRQLLLPDYCYICQSVAQCLHHSSYDDFILRGLDVRYLIPLCNKCHHAIEFDDTGRKLSVFQSSLRLTLKAGEQ